MKFKIKARQSAFPNRYPFWYSLYVKDGWIFGTWKYVISDSDKDKLRNYAKTYKPDNIPLPEEFTV